MKMKCVPLDLVFLLLLSAAAVIAGYYIYQGDKARAVWTDRCKAQGGMAIWTDSHERVCVLGLQTVEVD